MLHALARNWWVLLLRGVCAMVAGVIAFVNPAIALFVLVILIGANALVEGVGCMYLGAKGGAGGRPWWEMLLLGLLGVIFGIMTFAWPGLTAFVLLLMIAYWSIVRGIMEIIVAIRMRKVIEDEWMLGLSGVFSIALGMLLLYRPIAGEMAMVMVVGIFMFMFGALAVAFSLRLRAIKNRLHH